jgi:Asp-tRNA(Asn)/Glu-tRNA(Gln) amidotransferase B subunit
MREGMDGYFDKSYEMMDKAQNLIKQAAYAVEKYDAAKLVEVGWLHPFVQDKKEIRAGILKQLAATLTILNDLGTNLAAQADELENLDLKNYTLSQIKEKIDWGTLQISNEIAKLNKE